MSDGMGECFCPYCEGRIEWTFSVGEPSDASELEYIPSTTGLVGKERADKLTDTVIRDWTCPNCGQPIVVRWKLEGKDPSPVRNYNFVPAPEEQYQETSIGPTIRRLQERDRVNGVVKDEEWWQGDQKCEPVKIARAEDGDQRYYFVRDDHTLAPDFGHWAKVPKHALLEMEKMESQTRQTDTLSKQTDAAKRVSFGGNVDSKSEKEIRFGDYVRRRDSEFAARRVSDVQQVERVCKTNDKRQKGAGKAETRNDVKATKRVELGAAGSGKKESAGKAKKKKCAETTSETTTAGDFGEKDNEQRNIARRLFVLDVSPSTNLPSESSAKDLEESKEIGEEKKWTSGAVCDMEQQLSESESSGGNISPKLSPLPWQSSESDYGG